MTDEPPLSRRTLLAGLGTVGVGAALGITGTTARLHDTESVASTVTAGDLDIQLDWRVVHNGREVARQDAPVNTDGDGRITFRIEDVKPGDHGCLSFSVHNHSNPAWLWHRLGISNRDDNDLTEPERKSGDHTGGDGEGELTDHVQLRAFHDDDNDCEWNGSDCLFTTWRTLTDYAGIESVTGDGTPLDGLLLDGLRGPTRSDYSRVEDGDLGGAVRFSPFFPTADRADTEYERWYGYPFSARNTRALLEKQTGTQYLTYQWHIPRTVGNEIQGDSAEISFSFYAQQARHNGHPQNPYTGGEPEVALDLVPGVDPGDTNEYYTGGG